MRRTALIVAALLPFVALLGVTQAGAASTVTPCQPRFCALDRAVNALVSTPGGPPGMIVVVQKGSRTTTVSAGVADLTTKAPMSAGEEMRLASVSKAYSGAAALALVSSGRLSLNDTIGKWLPTMPKIWSAVTLRQLLNHTSRIRDFSAEDAFIEELLKSPQNPPPPADLLNSVKGLSLRPDNEPAYSYSNSDNILVALMVAAAAKIPYEDVLASRVFGPLGLTQTSLPRGSSLASPFVHGYQLDPPNPVEDVTSFFAAGWTWASGGIVATPLDASKFIRGYVGGQMINRSTRNAQFQFIPGNSEPPGPGTNAAGLGLFRYSTSCGTVYGHTGNTSGYTQFVAASRDGSRSVTVSINLQINPKMNSALFPELRAIDELGVCAALH
jgi:D-alanyl-D-alanine carboxypeptidase